MSIKKIIAALIVLSASGAAMAEAPYPVEKPFVSTTTRAAVKADLVRAEKAGLVNQADAVYPIVDRSSAADLQQHAGNVQASTYAGA
ncbi:DUF4148 domain-containing protein [Herbaspirillum lusitanum]|uniref:DUF4148 domain-containing protein n=1 Tax=Herbaspirillum lusitanum TaxID=213312 RepID=A0ABW9AGD3_9BURK